jgi:glycerophosphoryl diester phosphodiesterase
MARAYSKPTALARPRGGGDNRPVSAPRLYAHRGAAAELPENTLPSFRRALELGADALEMDVHMTSDGVVVVSHDPDGARMCGVARELRRASFAEVATWDAGWGFAVGGERPFAGQGLTIPRLEDVVDEFPDVHLNVDLKQAEPSMVEPVLALVRRRRVEHRVTLASFRLRTMLAIRAGGFGGRTALAPPEALALVLLPRPLFRRLPHGGAAQLPLAAGPLHFDRRRVIDRCHDLGLAIEFWTVNDPAEADRLLELGADGIMTDDPRAIGPVLARHRARRG